MGAVITYKGSTIATVDRNSKTLNTAGKYLEGNVVVEDVGDVPDLNTYTATILATNSQALSLFHAEHNGTVYNSAGTFSFSAGDTINLWVKASVSVNPFIVYLSNANIGHNMFTSIYSVSDTTYGSSYYFYTHGQDLTLKLSGTISKPTLYIYPYYDGWIYNMLEERAHNKIIENLKSGILSFSAITVVNTHAFYSVLGFTSLFAPMVRRIDDNAFAFCKSLTNVYAPNLYSIGSSAFYSTALQSFSFSSLSSIGAYAFAYCSRLSSIYAPLLKSIGSEAFMSTGLTNIDFLEQENPFDPTYKYSLGASIFERCYNLTSISTSVISGLSLGVFEYCSNISTVSLPLVSNFYGGYIFYGCSSLRNVYFPLISSIGFGYIFGDCSNFSSLTAEQFPILRHAGSNAFARITGLTYVDLPMLSDISFNCFYSCPKLSFLKLLALPSVSWLSSMSIPTVKTAIFEQLSVISGYAFRSAYNLLSLYLLSSSVVKLSLSTAFSSTPISNYTTSTGGVYGSIFVPASLYATYKASTNWVNYSARFVSLTDVQIQNVINLGTHELPTIDS